MQTVHCCSVGINHRVWHMNIACADPERGKGGPTPSGNHKYIWFVRNTCPGPLKNHKTTIIGTPA